MIRVYTQIEQGTQWLQRYRGSKPLFACVLGFTDTGLIPGISAAGATPHDRQYTCLADAEFLVNGVRSHPKYPLPPLQLVKHHSSGLQQLPFPQLQFAWGRRWRLQRVGDR